MKILIMSKLKIYIQDYGVYGTTVVVAESPEHAHQLIEGTINYDKDNKEFEEVELSIGVIVENLGDR